ncbi:phosphatidate cytidylyltransferase [Corynebacterium sp. 153RC1]|uniref:phosphatidate cytidylyltransferase n=1 Tax=unclassified Corynebacterium TaxID=2624378 RepID=UPI00211CA2D1|nr:MULTISPECIES: phosphatidate cytidylyltransferase [unclassified Corynebacterium]MCQ9371455.1 phosphatidate cytidylyltransferase [Corynebacterium sp. 35RC1]MCQ9351628.1 phosphatidate cytidylyltransferase [Corynebacterium sp. 209RC1]MCQ9353997.1 phosphatidate cytidylyltransferase [Corynebacterium sp. 1222RC1]MCQ9355911.1 phosphatidate cytidylyltransferase [Corynebacterium sp. 122RC1]MCQ9358155.1 phosphatidate cytidylyltransferase [Corynebacterium sp. 142RC1]
MEQHQKSHHLPKPRNSAGRDLKAAITTGLILGALVLLAVFTLPIGWYLIVACAIAVATWEVHARLNEKGYLVQRWLLIIAGQAMLWMSWPFQTKGLVSAYVVAVLVTMFGRLFHHGRNTPPKNYLRDTAVSIFVLTWIPLFGSFAAMLSRLETESASPAMFIITFMLCVIASDTGGYITGVMFGKRPMAPAVSPKKSWEGFAGSVFFGMLTGSIAVTFLLGIHWWIGALLGLCLVVCATLGDLVESQFKRELGIKDMSSILPGHGGLMDRLDGMLPAAMVTWLLLSSVMNL